MISIAQDLQEIKLKKLEDKIKIEKMWMGRVPPDRLFEKRFKYLNFVRRIYPELELQSEFLDGRRTKLYPYDSFDYYVELHAPAVHYRVIPNEIVIDLDEGDVKTNLIRIIDTLNKLNAKYFLGHSGNRGYHIHVFLAPPNGDASELAEAKGCKKLSQTVFEWILEMAKVDVADVDQKIMFSKNHTIRSFYSLNLKGKKFKTMAKTDRGIWVVPSALWNRFLEMVKDSMELESFEEEIKKYNNSVRRRNGRLRPCIQNAIKRIGKEELDHKTRVAIVTEMYHNGYSIEDIVNVFRNSPDFDENITRYQVEHITGKLGKVYKPFRCSTLKKIGVCDLSCSPKSKGAT